MNGTTNRTMVLCTPCAAHLAETRTVKEIPSKHIKVTCSRCGRRRFGGMYEVSGKKAGR